MAVQSVKTQHMTEDQARQVSAKLLGETERRIDSSPRFAPKVSDIAKRIRKLREACELSRPKFSALLDNMPATTLKNYELAYREPGAKIIQDIGNIFGGEVLVWLVLGRGVLDDVELKHRVAQYKLGHIVG